MDNYSYQLQHLPDMVGKPKPWSSLMEDYYTTISTIPKRKRV